MNSFFHLIFIQQFIQLCVSNVEELNILNLSSSSPLCVSSIVANDCPLGEYLEINEQENGNRCPKCRGGLGFGVGGCNPKNARRKCAPGLICEDSVCILNKLECAYTNHLKHLKHLPTCQPDGKFAAKQCKGDMVSGRCFCYNEQGNRIFGFDWRKNAENMTCACSQLKSNLASNGEFSTLHCSSNGNYEELQCSFGICWCANSMTGAQLPNTRAVPETMWTSLPCYDVKLMGTQYLRQCEYSAYAQNLVRTAFFKHGTLNVGHSNVICDYDGGFGIYQIENGIASCRWRDGSRIGSYQDGANAVAQMNCVCARDQKIFEIAGFGFTLSCTGNGNYYKLQGINGKIFCVDKDGFPVTDYLNTTSAIHINCDQYYYDQVTEPLEEE